MPPRHATNDSHGVLWTLDLDRDDLIPGQLATGRLRLDVRNDIRTRGLIVALVATEQ